MAARYAAGKHLKCQWLALLPAWAAPASGENVTYSVGEEKLVFVGFDFLI